MASSYSFQTYEECYESFLSEVLKDILNSEISFTLDLLVIEPRVIQFQISLPLGACPIWKIICVIFPELYSTWYNYHHLFSKICNSFIVAIVIIVIISLQVIIWFWVHALEFFKKPLLHGPLWRVQFQLFEKLKCKLISKLNEKKPYHYLLIK